MSDSRSQFEIDQEKRKREFLRSLNPSYVPKESEETDHSARTGAPAASEMPRMGSAERTEYQSIPQSPEYQSIPQSPIMSVEIGGKSEEDVSEAPETVVYTEYEPETKGGSFLRALLTTIFVLGIAAFCAFECYTLRNTELELRNEAKRLEAEIEVEKAKVLEYQVEQVYYDSDQYKEDMARNRFRLIYPGEVMIQVN